MMAFTDQVRKHCHECSVPLRGHGQLACDRDPETAEQTSEAHKSVFRPKDERRALQMVTERSQLEEGRIEMVTKYLQNGSK
jgi:hypothetical protein